MPFVLTDLVIDRVDLVDEGANSSAFVELVKRKERTKVMDVSEIIAKMKPEHAEVVQAAIDASAEELAKANTALSEANDALADANAELDTLKKSAEEQAKACGTKKEEAKKADDASEEEPKDDTEGDTKEKDDEEVDKKSKGTSGGGTSFDEGEVLKAMPEAIREEFLKMRQQKEAAEEQVRKAAEEKEDAEAVAKAASMKALPIEQSKLVGILKGAPEDVVDLLSSVSAALESTALDEVGKNAGNGSSITDPDAWGKIESKAEEIAKRDAVTKQKAIQIALNENPELYRDYLYGGAN